MRTRILPLIAILLLLPGLALADICQPCDGPPNHIQVPLEGRNYAGPAKYEGDIYPVNGVAFGLGDVSVSILIDGVLSPTVFLAVLNPGAKQFIRWTTAALLLGKGAHTMIITVTDLGNPSCPTIDTIHFLTR